MKSTRFTRRLIKTLGKTRAKKVVKPLKNKRVQALAKYGGLFIVVTTVAKIVVFGGALIWGIVAVAS